MLPPCSCRLTVALWECCCQSFYIIYTICTFQVHEQTPVCQLSLSAHLLRARRQLLHSRGEPPLGRRGGRPKVVLNFPLPVLPQLLIAPAFVGMALLYRLSDTSWERLTAWVYGMGLCALFLVSTVFHTITWKKSHMRSGGILPAPENPLLLFWRATSCLAVGDDTKFCLML